MSRPVAGAFVAMSAFGEIDIFEHAGHWYATRPIRGGGVGRAMSLPVASFAEAAAWLDSEGVVPLSDWKRLQERGAS